MDNTIREIIILYFMARAANILTANGYATGIGAKVIRARKKLGEGEIPAVVIIPGAEKAENQYGFSKCKMEIRIEGIMAFGASDPSVISEKILGDLKKCFLSSYNELTSPPSGWSRSPDCIDSIVYTGGGTDEYPDDDQITVGAYAIFEVGYTTKSDDPCSQ